jgi:FKBP-type peptidyl-prolyl cis-trans isomerase
MRHLYAVCLAVGLTACSPRPSVVITPSGLRYRILVAGSGPSAHRGQEVTIHETTTLTNGTLIFSSLQGDPITFLLGGDQVIAGVDEGVAGMKVGETRELEVPPALSHRSSYPANTPPDSTLLITVRLVALSTP